MIELDKFTCLAGGAGWLGVWFDKKLTFRHHVDTKVAAAKKVAQFLQHLSNTKGGLPAAAARRAVIACVLPTALYGAETWYAGLSRPALNSNTNTSSSSASQIATLGTGQKGLACRVEKVITAAARAILPVWRTTPTSSLLRDAGLPMATVALEGVRLRFATRLQRVDQQHPLVQKLNQQVRQQTRLQRTGSLLPKCPRPTLLQPQYLPGSQDPIVLQSRKEAAQDFQDWLKTVPDNHIIIYSDGSKAPDGATGFGFVIYRNNRRIAQGCGRLGVAEVFDGEAEGARAGLRRPCLPPKVSLYISVSITPALSRGYEAIPQTPRKLPSLRSKRQLGYTIYEPIGPQGIKALKEMKKQTA